MDIVRVLGAVYNLCLFLFVYFSAPLISCILAHSYCFGDHMSLECRVPCMMPVGREDRIDVGRGERTA